MEEAKVVYVVYESGRPASWTGCAAQAVSDADLTAELDRLKALLAYPDGTPLDWEARWAELGARRPGRWATASAATT